MNKNELKGYYREIRKNLVGARKDREGFLRGLAKDIDDYIEIHPDCTMENIYLNFGKPSHVADSFISVSEEGSVKSALLRRKRLRIFIVTIALALVVIIATFFLTEYIRSEQFRNGVFVETITVDDPANSQHEPFDSSDPDVRVY